jgi:hypothetical protein
MASGYSAISRSLFEDTKTTYVRHYLITYFLQQRLAQSVVNIPTPIRLLVVLVALFERYNRYVAQPKKKSILDCFKVKRLAGHHKPITETSLSLCRLFFTHRNDSQHIVK